MRGHHSCPSGMGTGTLHLRPKTSGLVSDLSVMESFQTPGSFPFKLLLCC